MYKVKIPLACAKCCKNVYYFEGQLHIIFKTGIVLSFPHFFKKKKNGVKAHTSGRGNFVINRCNVEIYFFKAWKWQKAFKKSQIADIIQRIMHSLVKMKLWFYFTFVAIFFCIYVHSHFIMCLAPWLCKAIYIQIYMKEIYSLSTTDDVLFYCWIKLFSKLLLPVVSKLCNGLGQ